MSPEPSKWPFDMTSGRHERIQREFSVTGFIFTYAQKYFSGHLTGDDLPLATGSAECRRNDSPRKK